MQLERRQFGLVEVKAAGDEPGTFSGYGAVFGNVDSYGDIIAEGAFSDTLADWDSKGKLPKMLLQHGAWGVSSDDMIPIGLWTAMKEDSKGLYVEGKLFALETDRGRYVYDGLKTGALDGLSIGYQTVNSRSEVIDEQERRILTELKLFEVSVVTFPANDRALVSSVKNLAPEQLRDLEDALGERGLSRTDRVKAVSVFKDWLRREAGEPISTPRDEGMPDAAAAVAAAEALAARFAVGALKF